MRFIYFDEYLPDQEADSGTFAGSAPDQDYNQLIYEYLVSNEEVNYNTELENINNNLEWIVALLLLIFSLYLMNCCRRWINKITGGGLNDVS